MSSRTFGFSPESERLKQTIDPVTAERSQPTLRFGFTIVAHPDPRRVGAWATFKHTLEVGRLTPKFSVMKGSEPEPLQDRFISRQPIMVARLPDGSVRISRQGSPTSLTIDGVPVEDAVSIPTSRIRSGVVLVLADRVALLLHEIETERDEDSPDFGLIGTSRAVATVRKRIRQVAEFDVPVLIRGESGVGKELIARAVHRASSRADRRFEAINMAAIPPQLASSELFGHQKGAFTGAERNHQGCFSRTHQGTLFLDEVGDAPAEVQVQLLRVLETGEFSAVGANTVSKVDVRVIAATDVDLDAAMDQGRFRRALLERLAGYQIGVAPLRERREDIGALVLAFVRATLSELGQSDLVDSPDQRRPWLAAPVVARLARHDWPGNVRQLRNVVSQLVISGRHEAQLVCDEELEALLGTTRSSVPALASMVEEPPDTPEHEAGRANRDPSDVSEQELLSALKRNEYRLAPTATDLRIARASLYALVEQSSRVRKAAAISPEEILDALGAADGKVSAAAAQLEVSAHALKLRMTALGLKGR